jgi:hypothetical protein
MLTSKFFRCNTYKKEESAYHVTSSVMEEKVSGMCPVTEEGP